MLSTNYSKCSCPHTLCFGYFLQTVDYSPAKFAKQVQTNYSGNIWRDFQLQYAQRYGHTLSQADEPNALDKDAFQSSPVEDMLANEPTGLSRIDFTQNRLPTLVCMAIEQQKISISRGAEIMGISLYEIRDLASSWVAERPDLL